MFTECVVPAHKANERSCLSSDDRSPSSSTRSETTTLLMLHGHKNKQQESFRKLGARANSAVISLEDGAGLFTDRLCLSCIYRPVNPYFAKTRRATENGGKTKSNYAASPVSSEVRLHICIGNLAKVIIKTL